MPAPIQRQSPRPAMAKTGSVLIHPRNRVVPPPPPAPPEEPTAWQRMLRLLGVGT